MKKNTFDPRHELTDKQYIYKDGEMMLEKELGEGDKKNE